MKEFFSKLKDYGVLTWFVLSALVAVVTIGILNRGRKRRNRQEIR